MQQVRRGGSRKRGSWRRISSLDKRSCEILWRTRRDLGSPNCVLLVAVPRPSSLVSAAAGIQQGDCQPCIPPNSGP
ncbi:hypothetical protein IG631_21259 [Alternaria alternata]|nr:hypothetical protein IG631_21259 [Alternaria alternata]